MQRPGGRAPRQGNFAKYLKEIDAFVMTTGSARAMNRKLNLAGIEAATELVTQYGQQT